MSREESGPQLDYNHRKFQPSDCDELETEMGGCTDIRELTGQTPPTARSPRAWAAS